MANGGDGYPNFSSRMTSQDIMEEVVADYITANYSDRAEGPRWWRRAHHLPGRQPGTAPDCPVTGSVSLTFRTRVPRVHDRAGAPRLMAAGRRLLSAVVFALVAVGLPATAAGHDGITGVFVEPDLVNPGGVIVVRGDNVSTDDPVRVELVSRGHPDRARDRRHRRRGPFHGRREPSRRTWRPARTRSRSTARPAFG